MPRVIVKSRMDDPNVTYKAAFRALAEKLGRVPTVKDGEWLVLHNNYSRSWAPAEETVTRPVVSAAGPVDIRPSRQPAPQARAIDAREAGPLQRLTVAAAAPLSRPTINPPREEAESVPEPAVAPSRLSQRYQEGDRGPSGGLVSRCVACGWLWERPKVKGRPNYKCEECR